MATDTSEKGLETLIVRHMTGTDGLHSEVGKPGVIDVLRKGIEHHPAGI